MRNPELLSASVILPFCVVVACSSEPPPPPPGNGGTNDGNVTATVDSGASNTTSTTVTSGGVGPTSSTVATVDGGSTTTGTTGAMTNTTGVGGSPSTTGAQQVTNTDGSMGGMSSTDTTNTVTTDAGMTSTTGEGTTGNTTVDPMTYAADIHGYTLFTDCNGNTTQVCRPAPGPCDNGTCPDGCPNNDDQALRGTTQHQTRTFGADAPDATLYDVTFRVQGIVETKRYSGGVDQDDGAQIPADGFYAGGVPNNSDGYNVYMIRVECPTLGCSGDYFLNSIGIPGDDRIRHAVFEIDYVATIPMEAKATVHFVSADNNCSAIDNCGENPPGGSDCPNPTTFDGLDAAIAAEVGQQPYDGQFVGISVQSVTQTQ